MCKLRQSAPKLHANHSMSQEQLMTPQGPEVGQQRCIASVVLGDSVISYGSVGEKHKHLQSHCGSVCLCVGNVMSSVVKTHLLQQHIPAVSPTGPPCLHTSQGPAECPWCARDSTNSPLTSPVGSRWGREMLVRETVQTIGSGHLQDFPVVRGTCPSIPALVLTRPPKWALLRWPSPPLSAFSPGAAPSFLPSFLRTGNRRLPPR